MITIGASLVGIFLLRNTPLHVWASAVDSLTAAPIAAALSAIAVLTSWLFKSTRITSIIVLTLDLILTALNFAQIAVYNSPETVLAIGATAGPLFLALLVATVGIYLQS